ncbi:hypothetical protein Vadar_026638 [Vaccinium darrowii]|uniref:Uncharacterized protein n=1 Tax=Vaccinium darrowii TaxID=229202 RepID=A0ACB7ZGL4_9ERIC|nr:hypothetical protein Vadar_026638 [Vaccinium darrowii]
MERESGKIHVVLLPYPAFGHLTPFYELAIALAKAGVYVSYISTQKNIQRLPKPPQNLSPMINFASLPFPVLDSNQLPEGAEATIDLLNLVEQVPYLSKALDLLQKPLEKFVVEHSPDWLVVDLLNPRATDVGKDLGVPVLGFSAFSAAACLFLGPPEYISGDVGKRVRPSLKSLTSPPEWVTFPSSVAYHNFEARGMSLIERIAKTINSCQAVAVRNSRELGGEYLSLYAKLIGKPVIPVGLLPPENPKELQITDESWIETFKWLDQQEPKSRINFQKQKVCIGWAPQKEILAHPSIGGSLFHAGWGSAIETLQFGHCLVVLPFVVDQGLNARFLVEKGLAIEIERGEDGSFERSDIAMALRQAMARKEGEGMRAHSRDVAAVVGDQELHDGYVAEFVEYLKNGIGKHK